MESEKMQDRKQYFKEYNKKYYDTNKKEILESLAEKVQCELCHRTVRKCALKHHQTLRICKKFTEKRLKKHLNISP